MPMSEINPYKLKISQLRALDAVADLGLFSEAALKLELSQSAISHAISTLEEELGVVLLIRGRQGAKLTVTGEQIVQEARQVLKSLEEIGQKARLARGLESGQVRIAGFRSVTTHILPVAIAKFRRNFPGIEVLVSDFQHHDEAESELRNGRADIAFTYLPTPNDLMSWELLSDEYVLLLPFSEKVPLPPLTWEQIASYPLIQTPRDCGSYQLIQNHFAQFSNIFNVTYKVKEDSTIIGMVRQGLGATVMARLAAEPLPDGILAYNLPAPLRRVIGAAVLEAMPHPPAVYAFLDTLQKCKL
jgi:DNA-binding transcriptional LysR family regulator